MPVVAIARDEASAWTGTRWPTCWQSWLWWLTRRRVLLPMEPLRSPGCLNQQCGTEGDSGIAGENRLEAVLVGGSCRWEVGSGDADGEGACVIMGVPEASPSSSELARQAQWAAASSPAIMSRALIIVWDWIIIMCNITRMFQRRYNNSKPWLL